MAKSKLVAANRKIAVHVAGIVIGLVGILVLLMLIPICKGVK